jgi:glucose-1-phosphate cytidylyltransferase
MKLVILAGGLGTRISEETSIRPKPMVEIGGMPIIWHIMKIYSYYGVKEFIICCGYRGEMIKEFFLSYTTKYNDFTINIKSKNKIKIHKKLIEDWKITLVDTGQNTMTGGRLNLIKKFLKKNETFCLTYGDGLSDINIKNLISYHNKHKKAATMTIVLPPGRFGMVTYDKNLNINSFLEKPSGDGSWVNGGFFVLNRSTLDLVSKNEDIWEEVPLKLLAKQGNLKAYKHKGFWKAMDTLKDKMILEDMWKNNPTWKVWKS